MDIITAIEYFVSAVIMLYLIGLLLVWVYELRKNALYRHMQERIRFLENFRQSMAVLHAKKYKVIEDYRRDISGIERVQQSIQNLLFIGKKNHRDLPLGGNVSSGI